MSGDRSGTLQVRVPPGRRVHGLGNGRVDEWGRSDDPRRGVHARTRLSLRAICVAATRCWRHRGPHQVFKAFATDAMKTEVHLLLGPLAVKVRHSPVFARARHQSAHGVERHRGDPVPRPNVQASSRREEFDPNGAARSISRAKELGSIKVHETFARRENPTEFPTCSTDRSAFEEVQTPPDPSPALCVSDSPLRQARSEGYRLVKSRRRDPDAWDYQSWTILNLRGVRANRQSPLLAEGR